MNSRFPHDTTRTFTDIWDKASDFETDVKTSGLHVQELDSKLSTIFYLLYARYGNSAIANWDETQFKYKVYSIIFQYGPSWAKRLDIQATLRGLSEAELLTGAKAINDHAFAMGDDNVTAGDAPTKIDQKTGTYYTKSKMDAYGQLWEILKTDVTNEFIGKFKTLFATFVYTRPDIFVTELEEEEEDDA